MVEMVMVDTQVASGRSRMGMVLKVIEERGEPPFIDVLEVIDHMINHMGESGLTDLDISIAVSRLVCNGQLRLALDGIRPV